MSGWVIRRNIAYEGLHEEEFSSAQEVIDRINDMSGLEADDIESIIPITRGGFDRWSFEEAFKEGKVA